MKTVQEYELNRKKNPEVAASRTLEFARREVEVDRILEREDAACRDIITMEA